MAHSVITNVTRSKGKLIKVEEEEKGETEISADVYGLEMEILAHLPAKTVQSLETVCKDWLQLIRSSYFVRLHLSRDNGRRIRVLVTTYVYPLILEYNNYYQNTKQKFGFPPPFSGPGWRRVLGSVDGLIIMMGNVSNECVFAVGVFNPSTGKCSVLKFLEKPPGCACSCSWVGKLADGQYVLAMICATHDFEIWVYKFTRSSSILSKICSTRVNLAVLRSLYDYGTLVQGVVYWPITSIPMAESPPRFQILAYHLSKNKHWVISPPAQCYFGLGSSVDGCNLIATFKRYRGYVVEVWIRKEDCWTKYANIEGSNYFAGTSPLGFAPNGDLIMEVGKSRLMRYSFNHKKVTPLMEYGFEGDAAIMCADTLVSPSC